MHNATASHLKQLSLTASTEAERAAARSALGVLLGHLSRAALTAKQRRAAGVAGMASRWAGHVPKKRKRARASKAELLTTEQAEAVAMTVFVTLTGKRS